MKKYSLKWLPMLAVMLAMCIAAAGCTEDEPCVPCECGKPDTTAVYPNFNYDGVMDTLKGEWLWCHTYQGGGYYEPEYKSVLKVFGQDKDGKVYYETYAGDSLYGNGSFTIGYKHYGFNMFERYIEPPNNVIPDVSDNATSIFWCGSMKGFSKDTLTFTDGSIDGFSYLYSRIK